MINDDDNDNDGAQSIDSLYNPIYTLLMTL
jgi:hypothetical protein